MKRKLLYFIISTSVISAAVYFSGLYETMIYAYRDYQHDKWLEEFLLTAEPTNAENAVRLKDAVTADYLGEQKDVDIFLPKGYHDNDSVRYPVLYFYDGDNLFDHIIGEGSEWEVDEVINRVDSAGGPVCIVVGIQSGDNRSAEYKPYPSDQVKEDGEVFGKAHAEWYARGLKQWVDANYRTKPEPEFTGIGGCSLGGLLAHYSLMNYPDVYGLGIIFSPSMWVDEPQSLALVDQHPDLTKTRIFLNSGKLEWPIVESSERLRDKLLAAGLPKDQLYFDIEPDEGHWHATWRKGFAKAYPWIIE